MPLCPQHISQQVKEAQSRLGGSLVKIQKARHDSAVESENLKSMFQSWEQKWMHRRELIASRIQTIEAQLKELAESELPMPQFTIFDDPGE
ncbi:hypothetical protein F1728_12730 [Gimesia benthica]|uniref:Uncharacterized protein n=1 Tax=Gimesia benthica TaxID=2608982 RepID=A0A6I6ABC1_9PLAN|nr:hypothetical protein [Gimesia benthica]QGQ23488.1 hypothetical protein F1728_12730 [Gimesia benthica]